MPEQDPLERLDRFATDLGAGVPVPYDTRGAGGARARGDRLRRRRHGLLAAAGAALVVAVAIPLVTGGGDNDADLVTGDPARSAPLSPADLMTDDDTVYSDGADWTVEPGSVRDDDTFRCARAGLDTVGATRRLSQRYLLDGEALDGADAPLLTETVAAFPDADAAAAALRTVDAWFTSCADQVSVYTDVDVPSSTTPVDLAEVGGDVEGQVMTMTFGPAPRDVDPTGDSSFFAEMGVVRNGDRIAVLSQTTLGQDYDFPPGATPVARMLGPAATRLAADGERDGKGDRAPASRIPASLDLSEGLGGGAISRDGEGVGDLAFCGADPRDLRDDVDERQAVGSRAGDGATETRELLVYADPATASEAAEGLLRTARDCPVGSADAPATSERTRVREESAAAVNRRATITTTSDDGVDVIEVVVEGPAVLLARRSSAPAADVPGLAPLEEALRSSLDPVVAALIDAFG